MSFMTFIIFSSILLSFGFVCYHELLLLSVTNNNNNNISYILNQKKQDGDGATILAYIAVIAALVLPHIPQID